MGNSVNKQDDINIHDYDLNKIDDNVTKLSSIKKEGTPSALKDNLHLIGAFVDNSGSTSGVIIQREMEFVERLIGRERMTTSVAVWNTRSRMLTNYDAKNQSEGGTDPCCIFHDYGTAYSDVNVLSLYRRSDIFLFITDGQIGNAEVERFWTQLKEHDASRKQLIILAIFSSDGLNEYTNISCLAPIIASNKNVLALHFSVPSEYRYLDNSRNSYRWLHGSEPRVSIIHQKGIQMRIDGSMFQEKDIMNLVYNAQEIAPNLIVVDEAATAYHVVSTDDIYNTTNYDRLSQLTSDQWTNIIQHATVSNQLGQLRTIVSNARNYELERVEMNNPIISKVRDIIKRMVQAFANGDTDVQTALKVEYEQYKTSYIAALANCSEKNNVRGKWDRIRDMIHKDGSRTMYTVGSFLNSNRAKRAVDIVEHEEDSTNITYDPTYPTMDCSIHLDKGPWVLWLRKVDDEVLKRVTDDFSMNYPLAYTNNLYKSMVLSNPVCGYCANEYVEYQRNNSYGQSVQTVYRENTVGYIPISWTTSHTKNTLCKSLGDSKSLGHLNLLFLAAVDDEIKLNGQSQLKWMKDIMIEQLTSTDTFDEEGQHQSLKKCLLNVFTRQDKLMRQPLTAVCRMYQLALEYNLITRDEVAEKLSKNIVYCVIIHFMNLLKNGKHRDIVNKILFKTQYDIPIQGTLVNDVTLQQLVDHHLLSTFEQQFIQLTIGSCNFSNEFKNVLYHLNHQTVHNKPSKVEESFIMYDRIDEKINEQFQRYKKLSGDDIYSMPGFAFNNGQFSGPSKLWFMKELVIPPTYYDKWIQLEEFTQVCKQQMDMKMRSLYGSIYPDSTSAHYNIHRYVAQEYFSIENKTRDDVKKAIFRRLKDTNGLKGNIYHKELEKEVDVLLTDIFNTSRQTSYMTGEPLIDMTIQHKMCGELKSLGFLIEDGRVFVDKNIIDGLKPHVIITR